MEPRDPHIAETSHGESYTGTIHLPATTAWPFMLALGVTLLAASLVTNVGVGALGFFLFVISAVGWTRNVIPHEAHEDVVVEEEFVTLLTPVEKVARIEVGETHRAYLPLQTFSLGSAIRGGIAGGIAMVIPAEIYGLVRFHSIWYVVNLLGGAGVGKWVNPSIDQLTHFHLSAFITANIIQGAVTLLVGLLYGAMLPMWPRHPILLGGLIAPALWTGLLYTSIGFINPYLADRIDWWSFAAAQVMFGLVAGYVVVKQGHISRLRQVPLTVRLGVETPGLHPEQRGGENKKEPRP